MSDSGAISGIDHVLVGVRDLEGAHETWQRLGFTLSPRGRHIGWGTANYCIMFPEDYIELLGILDPSQFTNNLDRFLETREGLMGLAFATGDAEAAAARLAEAGIAADGPKDLARLLDLPEGEAKPAFRLVYPAAEATPDLSAFICHHLTPELVRRPAWLEHANGALSIAAMTVAVEDPSALALAYGKLFGYDRVRVADGVVAVQSGGAEIRFADARHLQRLQPGALDMPDYDCPWPIALRLRVSNIAKTGDALELGRVRFRYGGDEIVRVPASEACGVILEFAES
ncbi:MAG: VOC family protein [Pseudomonadota bacterium]